MKKKKRESLVPLTNLGNTIRGVEKYVDIYGRVNINSVPRHIRGEQGILRLAGLLESPEFLVASLVREQANEYRWRFERGKWKGNRNWKR